MKKSPKYIDQIKEHYRNCYFERECLSCSNIIAFGVIQLENGFLKIDNFFVENKRRGMFWKYLQSLCNKRNECPHTISEDLIIKLNTWLSKQNQKSLEYFRDSYLFSNSEFKSENSLI